MERQEPWTRKHAPKKRDDLLIDGQTVDRVLRHVKEFRPGAKPLLIGGSTGVGKTSLVYTVAEELDLEVIEINASDVRNKAAIESLVGAASKQQSLFFRGRIILIDEVDGVSGVKDRGAVPALVKLVEETRHPMLFTANDAQSDKLKPLRKKAEVLTLPPPSAAEIAALLARIGAAEKVAAGEDALKAIAHRSGGDVRAAVNDLQSLAMGGSVSREDVELLSDREHQEAVEQALLRVFKTTSADVALPAFDSVQEQPDTLILWIDENLPREYTKPEDLARAYDALAEADRFFGRIRRWQYYRFYVYIYNLLSVGIALAKDEKYRTQGTYKRSSRPLSIWMYNQKNAKRKRLAEQLAEHLHTSKKQVERDVLPYLQYACRSKDILRALKERYSLDTDACAWLAK